MITPKGIISLLIAVLLVGVYSVPVLSDEGHGHQEKESSNPHGHQAPHGGKMATLGSHHVEVVVEDGTIKLFLYNDENQPVSVKEVSGQVHLTFPDKHRETLELEPSVNQAYLEARLKDPGHPDFKAVLSLMIDGKRQNVRLNL